MGQLFTTEKWASCLNQNISKGAALAGKVYVRRVVLELHCQVSGV